MVVKAEDTFTEASDTNLENHTPSPTGTAWVVKTAARLFIQGDLDAVNNIEADAVRYPGRETTDIGDDDMDITGVLEMQDTDDIGNTQFCGICARMTSANFDNYYTARIVDDAGGGDVTLRLFKIIGGSATELGTGFSLSGLGPFTVKLEIRSGTQKVFENAIERISATEADTVLQGNQFGGLENSDEDELNPLIDDYKSESVAAPPAARRRYPQIIKLDY